MEGAQPGGHAVDALHPTLGYHIVNTLGWCGLRPLQQAALAPLRVGQDALLLAPTAGGKTEAAVFPLLTRMAEEDWRGLSLLYVCPLRALLNNLAPRLAAYAGWLGRRAARWHGDTAATMRRRLADDPPDLLLTTPESLEAMLVSTRVTPRELFAGLRAVVVDEVHAFAGDDRGWHLLAVLERLTRLAGRPLQRVGLSATVGNPDALLAWLQGGNRGQRPAQVVAPPGAAAPPDLQLDYVGSAANAATVIAALHRGRKRLVFADSRRGVETLAGALAARGVTVSVSHASLSAQERHRAEADFAAGRDRVIVATSTLELGIDVGDLDHVIQVGAPGTVAALLQRLGRTGRRPGARPNLLLLVTGDEELVRAAGLLRLWGEGYVEPVVAPPAPRHLLAQQLLALCLQEGQVGEAVWREWLGGLPLATPEEAARITTWLVATGHLDRNAGMLFVGPRAERRYGRRNFLELVSMVTAAPEIAVRHGRAEIGTVDPALLTRETAGPRVLALAGRSWRVTHVDWRRRTAWVEPATSPGTARWVAAPRPSSYALCEAMRRVLLDGELAGVRLSRRAVARLAEVRERLRPVVDEAGTVLERCGGSARWWTWAGGRGNAVLAAALDRVAPGLVEAGERFDSRYLRLRGEATARELGAALAAARARFGDDLDVEPTVSAEAVRQLKFAELLPQDLAGDTLASRAADHMAAREVARRVVVTARGVG